MGTLSGFSSRICARSRNCCVIRRISVIACFASSAPSWSATERRTSFRRLWLSPCSSAIRTSACRRALLPPRSSRAASATRRSGIRSRPVLTGRKRANDLAAQSRVGCRSRPALRAPFAKATLPSFLPARQSYDGWRPRSWASWRVIKRATDAPCHQKFGQRNQPRGSLVGGARRPFIEHQEFSLVQILFAQIIPPEIIRHIFTACQDGFP